MIATLSASWPGLSRPSTSSTLHGPEDVDARDKRGHDGVATLGIKLQDQGVSRKQEAPASGGRFGLAGGAAPPSVLVAQPQMIAAIEPQVLREPGHLREGADRQRLDVIVGVAHEDEHG